MKMFIRGALVILVAGFAGSMQGGIITSGSFFLSSLPSTSQGTLSATVSGDNFAATVIDTQAQISFGGFPPLQLFLGGSSGITWGGEFGSSGVLYNGVFYSAPPFIMPLPGMPFALAPFNATLISPPPIITGPGTYNLDFSVTLRFQLYDSSHTLFHTETDTGFANGSITYTAVPGSSFVNAHEIDATIIPEPSTWSCIAFAGCFLGAFKLRRQLPG
jgi:hypothetical protein